MTEATEFSPDDRGMPAIAGDQEQMHPLNATSTSAEASAEDATTSPPTPARVFKCAGGGRPPGPGFGARAAPGLGAKLAGSPRKRSEDSL